MKGKYQSGFTLIEMLVSVALFTIVMTIALSVILSVIDGNKRTQSVNSVVNNLNSSIDSMVRDMKTGFRYNCDDILPVAPSTPSSCVSSVATQVLSFTSTITGDQRSVRYKYIPATATAGGYIVKAVCTTPATCPSGDGTRITSSEINVTDMRMYVKPGAAGVSQPGILLIISGTAKTNPTTVSNFSLQTFVSRRLLNI